MKPNWIKILAMSAALSTLGISFSMAQGTTPPNAPAPAHKNERHPEIRKAIHALERAKEDLQRANHDFGGHRAMALQKCDEAIEQLTLALQYDKE